MGAIDSILNWAIPLGIVLFLFFLFYSKFKDAFDLAFQKIAQLFSKIIEGSSSDSASQDQYGVVFR